LRAYSTLSAIGGGCAGLLLVLVCLGSAWAQATINDCEKIQAADAYNQCLAKFGPPAKSGNLEPERPGDIKSSSAEAAATGGKPARGRGHRTQRHRSHRHAARGHHGGRKTLSIRVGK
jgi:hypothetical protein